MVSRRWKRWRKVLCDWFSALSLNLRKHSLLSLVSLTSLTLSFSMSKFDLPPRGAKYCHLRQLRCLHYQWSSCLRWRRHQTPPPWILKRGELESSGRRLISSLSAQLKPFLEFSKISKNHFFSQNIWKKKKIDCKKKRRFPLVLTIEEISLWPELSTRFRIQGGWSERHGQRTDGRTEILVSNIGLAARRRKNSFLSCQCLMSVV